MDSTGGSAGDGPRSGDATPLTAAAPAETSPDDVEVSVVLPAYNEERTIEETVRVTVETLEAFLPPTAFEVVVAEDGCDDRTPEIADRLAAADPRVRHFHSDERLGRGGALERAFEASHGDTLVYFDTDLATDMKHLEELVERVRSEGFDVATGSRWMPGREASRPPKRGIPSRGFNLLVRVFLGSALRDHQCGFKALSREAFETLHEDVEDEHWFWDTELLVRAQRSGLDVAEFPVDWEPKGDTKVDLVRDIFGMGSQILRVWWQLSVRPRLSRRVTAVAGLLLTAFAIGLMSLYIDFGRVLEEIGRADVGLLALAAAVYTLSWPVRGVRYRDILRELGFYERAGFLTGAVFISQTGNLVFPMRAGDAVRAYVVKARRNIPYPSGFASLAAERVFDLLTITGLAGTVLLGYVATGQFARLVEGVAGSQNQFAVLVAGGVALAAIAVVAVVVLSARSDRNRVREAVEAVSSDSYADYVAGVLERFVGDVQKVGARPAAFGRVGASSVVIWTIDVLTAALVFAAFGVLGTLTVVELLMVSFFAVSVGNLAKVIPLQLPGGIGLYEGAFTLLVLALTPLTPGVVVGVAFVDHAVKNVVTIAGGVVSMLALNVSLTTAVEESSEIPESETRGETARN